MLFVILYQPQGSNSTEELLPFRKAYLQYVTALQPYRAEERLDVRSSGQQARRLEGLFFYFPHGDPGLADAEFRTFQKDDPHAFLRSLRRALPEGRSREELQEMLSQAQQIWPYRETWVLPEMGPLDRSKSHLYSMEVSLDQQRLRLDYSEANGHGAIVLDSTSTRLLCWEEQHFFGPDTVIGKRYFSPLGDLTFLASAERIHLRDAKELSRRTWHWQNPRSIKPTMTLAASLLAKPSPQWQLLLQLSDQVLNFAKGLRMLSAEETRSTTLWQDEKSKRRQLVGDFSILPLETDPRSLLEWRMTHLVDGRRVDLRKDAAKLFEDGFSSPEAERQAVKALAERFELGDLPFGFTLNLAPCFADSSLALFDHTFSPNERGGMLIHSQQLRGAGIIRAGLFAFRPEISTEISAKGQIERVHLRYAALPPFRFEVKAEYRCDELQRITPAKIIFRSFSRDTLIEERTHSYGPFRLIETQVQTSHEFGRNKN
jgi:hypothetical protein